MGLSVPPTPHAVLPHRKDRRFLLTAFVHVPFVDTKPLTSDIIDRKQVSAEFVRRYER